MFWSILYCDIKKVSLAQNSIVIINYFISKNDYCMQFIQHALLLRKISPTKKTCHKGHSTNINQWCYGVIRMRLSQQIGMSRINWLEGSKIAVHYLLVWGFILCIYK